MFTIALFIALVVLVGVCTALWCDHKRETARKAGDTNYVGRHRAEDRPTMTWRG